MLPTVTAPDTSRQAVAETTEDLGEPEATSIVTKFPLDVRKAEFSIFELHRRWRNGTLQLDPEYQREFVWTPEKQVKLVESVLSFIPLPVIYLSDDGETLEVVDGQQRLTTLFAFMEGRFADSSGGEKVILRKEEEPGTGRPFKLKGLRLIPEFKELGFDQLDARMRRKFEETQLSCFVLHAQTDPRAKYELFERINEGTTPLNPQEIRNALFPGPGRELINRLALPSGRFRSVAGQHRSFKRMRANELVLRGLAFSWRGWEHYKGDLVGFLNDSLTELNKASPSVLASVERTFLRAVDFAERVFGTNAWQRFNPDARDWSGYVSGPLVEAVSFAAAKVFPVEHPTRERAEAIRTAFQQLCTDSSFVGAILTATQTQQNVVRRLTSLERICLDAV